MQVAGVKTHLLPSFGQKRFLRMEFALVRFKGDQEKAASIYETKEGPRLGCTGEDMAKIVYFATDEVGNDEELKKEFGASCTATKC